KSGSKSAKQRPLELEGDEDELADDGRGRARQEEDLQAQDDDELADGHHHPHHPPHRTTHGVYEDLEDEDDYHHPNWITDGAYEPHSDARYYNHSRGHPAPPPPPVPAPHPPLSGRATAARGGTHDSQPRASSSATQARAPTLHIDGYGLKRKYPQDFGAEDSGRDTQRRRVDQPPPPRQETVAALKCRFIFDSGAGNIFYADGLTFVPRQSLADQHTYMHSEDRGVYSNPCKLYPGHKFGRAARPLSEGGAEVGNTWPW
ncbi:hypothetical protein B0H12DRAFT_1237798, partial [Mycena haematopus]